MTKMSIEAEAAILFAIGVVVVLIYEIVAGIILKKGSRLGKALIGHAVCLLLTFAAIVYLSGGPETHEAYSGSGWLALIGILWAVGEFILVRALFSADEK